MMKQLSISFTNSLLTKPELSRLLKRLGPSLRAVKQASKKGYDTDYASINLPVDTRMLRHVEGLVRAKQRLKPVLIVVAGIGGSNLGTIAVQEAVLGKQYNLSGGVPKVLYADTVDTDSISFIIGKMDSYLKKGKQVILNGVSKSGGTTETIANFSLLVDVIKKRRKDFQRYIVVTTDRNSKYWRFAEEKGYEVLEIPKLVGGRYSVFSPVGLFPLGLLGVDIRELLRGARAMREKILTSSGANPAARGAISIFANWKRGKTIYDTFLFSNDLESIGKWYRQLMGESVGKEKDKKGRRVWRGITPTVSMGSTDLHSMAQLYLGGPHDKYSSIITVGQVKKELTVQKGKGYGSLVPNVEGKSLSKIMDAIVKGVTAAFRKGKRPYNEITIPDKSAYAVGQLLQLKMIEMIHLGFLLDVNPFDQPNVEDYKIETKRYLARG